MRITLGNMLIRAVAGQAGNSNWRTVSSHVALLKARTLPPIGQGPIQADPFDGLDQTPDLENADCITWKLIDAHYTQNRDRLRDAWRHTPARPKQSTYDAYMKYALPHSLRGLTAPDYIPPSGTKLIDIRQYALNNLTAEQATEYAANELLPLSPKNRLHALHYAAATRYIGTVAQGPPPTHEYRATYYVEALDYARPHAWRFWLRVRTRYDLDPTAVGPWGPWTLADRWAIGLVEDPASIQGLDIDYAPPQRNPNGSLTEPAQPDFTRLIPLRNLHRLPYITTWPRLPHSTRGSHLPNSLWSQWQLSILAGGYWRAY